MLSQQLVSEFGLPTSFIENINENQGMIGLDLDSFKLIRLRCWEAVPTPEGVVCDFDLEWSQRGSDIVAYSKEDATQVKKSLRRRFIYTAAQLGADLIQTLADRHAYLLNYRQQVTAEGSHKNPSKAFPSEIQAWIKPSTEGIVFSIEDNPYGGLMLESVSLRNASWCFGIDEAFKAAPVAVNEYTGKVTFVKLGAAPVAAPVVANTGVEATPPVVVQPLGNTPAVSTAPRFAFKPA